MKKYIIQYEVPYNYKGVVPLVYHPYIIVSANNLDEAKEKVIELFSNNYLIENIINVEEYKGDSHE